MDLDTGETELIALVDADEPRSLFNDGKVDRRGRFFAGGEDEISESPICGLFRLDPDLTVHELERGIICNNGPSWSPDNKTFYHTDSYMQEIYAYDYDVETGAISNKRVFANTHDEPGIPDGSTIDEEGYLWNAQIVSGQLVRYAPDGTVDRRVPVPTKTHHQHHVRRRQPGRGLPSPRWVAPTSSVPRLGRFSARPPSPSPTAAASSP